MTPLYWVIRVGDEYLDTLHWGILTGKQRQAFRFTTRAQARRQVEAWRGCPEYEAKGIRVVRIVKRRDVKPENVTIALNILMGALDCYDFDDDRKSRGGDELRDQCKKAYQTLLVAKRVETPKAGK